MSAFKQKLARFGATAGLLAASTAAVMGVGGVTAGSAIANPVCEEIAGVPTLQAEGSTLQEVAQIELWSPAYNSACASPKVHLNYTGTGSGAALTAFAYNGTSVNTNEAFVGTEEAPGKAQIENAKSHAGGASPVMVPVAQTSIAIVAHLPAGCSIKGGITWKDLNEVFAGAIKQWSELETDNGGCGTQGITRVVPGAAFEKGSGTAFQFKNYLATLQFSKSAIGPGEVEISAAEPKCATKSWAEIRNNSSTPNLNLVWPEDRHTVVVGGEAVEVGCATPGTLSSVVRAHGDSGVINYVKGNVDTIGFSAYSDVVANTAISNVVPLESLNEGGTLGYAAPGIGTETKEANCGGRQYTVPSSTTGLEVDWSGVFGANPNIGVEGTFYPLCTLTYDLSWHGTSSGYTTASYGSGARVGKTVKDYLLNYVLETAEGQALLNSHGYETLPSTGGVTHEVLKAARLAAGMIN